VPDRLELDELGLDELVIESPRFVHIERMSDTLMWVGIYKGRGNRRVSLFFESRGRIRVNDGDGDLEMFFRKPE
jgi:hypothetical protein